MIVFSDDAIADLERILEFNYARDPATALQHVQTIREAVLILDAHPRIGRPIGAGTEVRELVISYSSTGYIAAYEHNAAAGLVLITAVRHQREAGYRDR